jgi:predicted Zn finger-like uncharacterized protein
MRLSCPNCQTEYNVPDAALLGRTRTLRCVNCGTQWQAGPLEAEPEPTPKFEAPPPPPPAIKIPEPQPAYAAAAGAETRQTPPTSAYQDPAPFTSPPPNQTRPAIDPAEARSIADRESFAALLESSRQQAAAQSQEEAPPPAKKRRINPLLISILALLIIIGLIVIERTPIMAAWPPSIRLFEALGLK